MSKCDFNTVADSDSWRVKIYFQFHNFAIWSISASILSIITWKAPASTLSISKLAMFLKIDPWYFRMLGKFQDTTQRFLCRRPVLPDYLSVSYDYDLTDLAI